MRKINKNNEPISLTKFLKKNRSAKYVDLDPSVRIDIRNSCLKEQFYLCAYCCQEINEETCHNEHILAQNSLAGVNYSLDFSNIVASCDHKNHCGIFKKNNSIEITPLQDACITSFSFNTSGIVTGINEKASKTIDTLNLNHKSLKYQRKTMIDIALYTYEDLNTMQLENDDVLEALLIEYETVDNNGKMKSLSPVVVNAIKHYLANFK